MVVLPIVLVVILLVFAFVGVPILASRMAARTAADAAARALETEQALQEMARGRALATPAPASPGPRAPSRAVQGRGLVLQSNSTATSVTRNGRRFDLRILTLEVEIPGMAPFVVQGAFLLPRGQVEALPGASLEVVVDGRSASDVTVLGPGGFTGPWLNAGPPLAY